MAKCIKSWQPELRLSGLCMKRELVRVLVRRFPSARNTAWSVKPGRMEVNLRMHREKRERRRSGTGIKSGRVPRVARGPDRARIAAGLPLLLSSPLDSPSHAHHTTSSTIPFHLLASLSALFTSIPHPRVSSLLPPRPPFSLSFLDNPPCKSTRTYVHACVIIKISVAWFERDRNRNRTKKTGDGVRGAKGGGSTWRGTKGRKWEGWRGNISRLEGPNWFLPGCGTGWNVSQRGWLVSQSAGERERERGGERKERGGTSGFNILIKASRGFVAARRRWTFQARTDGRPRQPPTIDHEDSYSSPRRSRLNWSLFSESRELFFLLFSFFFLSFQTRGRNKWETTMAARANVWSNAARDTSIRIIKSRSSRSFLLFKSGSVFRLFEREKRRATFNRWFVNWNRIRPEARSSRLKRGGAPG